ncbi:rho GTPase-activating protein SYDE2 [Sigmodon hispidus]
MAEPLRRRTFGQLRERRGPGVLELCADTEGRSPHRGIVGPGMEQSAWGIGLRSEQPGERVPWTRGAQEASALGRVLPRAIPDPDGEDEGADYYENLPLGCAPQGAEALRASPSPAAGSSPGVEGGRLETGRLQTQLREAYYLLIQAMHDLPPDSGTRRGGPAGARAQGQPSPLPHDAAVRSACSPRGDDRPSQQVSPPRSPPKETGVGRPPSPRMRLSTCRSLESLRVSPQPPLLQRWASDSWIACTAHRDRDEPPPRGGGMDGWRRDSHRATASAALLPSICQDPGRSSERPYRDLAGTSVISSSQEDRPEGPPLLKPPAVTVKKLQKWMYKGRLLSLGMKGRARGTALKVPGAQATSPNLGSWKVHENHVLSVTTDRRITLTGPGIFVSTSRTELRAMEPSSPSPSPVKKGSSITWSLPDKIKSPRTVRKLSMKMKRLPEFSRKLGARGASPYINSPGGAPSLSKCNCGGLPHSVPLSSGNPTRNVISRYHLDTTVSSQHSYRKKATGTSKYSCKGGYLSDGDSPELRTKSSKPGLEHKLGKGREAIPSSCTKNEIDIDAFRHYSFADQPKCSQYISGLMSVHFYGAEGLKPPRIDSKDVFCAIQVDSVNKARTALLTCRTTFLDMDHTFNIEIENAQHLKLVVFSWEPTPRRNRVCCHGTIVLPTLFRVTKTHQLAVKLEPRGLIYVKVTLMEQWENSLHGLDKNRESVMFGVDIQKVVEKENVGSMVPLLIQKCIVEIEKRGCQVVGLYRLCGSAAVKKELREAFEKDSKAVGLCETQYPDINVITGVLKDYLRELPSPLITKQLYEAVLDAMAKSPLKMSSNGCENESSDSTFTVGLLNCLPDVEKATLKMLLDHLKLVASYHEVNKMTCQNLAVCFGPVLLNQRQETSTHNNRVFTDCEELASALDFKKHIEVLHYLLQLWPVQRVTVTEPTDSLCLEQSSLNYLRRKKERPCVLNLSSMDSSGMLRPRQARLDSPLSNRYAGDWSSCGESYFLNMKENFKDLDYDDVPLEDGENRDYSKMDGAEVMIEQQIPMSKACTFQTYLTVETIGSTVNQKANLRDLQESIDTLIGNLERELNKNKLNMSV